MVPSSDTSLGCIEPLFLARPATHIAPRCRRLQVCNHPELFEGQAERWPFTFAAITTAHNPELTEPPVPAGPGRPPKQRVIPWVQVTGFSSHLQFVLPRLLYSEGLMGQAAAVLGGHLEGARELWLNQRMQLFTACNVHQLLQREQQVQQQKTLSKQHEQPQRDSTVEVCNGATSNKCSSSSSASAVWGFQPELSFNTGYSVAVFCGMSPSQVAAAAAGDLFQKWELAYAGRRGAAAAEAWQQWWEDYGLDEQQWQQQVLQLRRQQTGSVKQDPTAADDSQQQQQQITESRSAAGLFGSRMQVVAQQQYDQVQQQLLLLPPSRTALRKGKQQRNMLLLLVVDDVAAASSSSCSSSRGRMLRQGRAVWSEADRQQLLLIQQQQAADGASSSSPVAAALEDTRMLGVLLPPLVLSAKRRLLQATPMLRSVWGALIPPVLSPPCSLVCSSAGLMAQQAALTAAPW